MTIGSAIATLKDLSDQQAFLTDALTAILERTTNDVEYSLPGPAIIRGALAIQGELTERLLAVTAGLRETQS